MVAAATLVLTTKKQVELMQKFKNTTIRCPYVAPFIDNFEMKANLAIMNGSNQNTDTDSEEIGFIFD